MDQQQNFMDSRTIMAIVLVGVIWFGWQSYMGRKYPNLNQPTTQVAEKAVSGSPTAETPSGASTTTNSKVESKKLSTRTEKTLTFDDAVWKFSVSSQGMGVRDLTLKEFTDRSGNLVQVGAASAHLPLATLVDDETLDFQVSQVSPVEFVGDAEKGGIKIHKTLRVDSPNYLILSETKINGAVKSVTILLAEDSIEGAAKDAVGKQMGGDPTAWQTYFISHGTKTDHQSTSAATPLRENYDQVSVAALNGKYFGQALVDDSAIIPSFRTDFDETAKQYIGKLIYDLSSQKSSELKAKFYGGPRSLDTLRVADPRLEKSINYGMFGWLAGPLLKLMKWLYSVTSNYGVAIVLMTILVRLAVMPFNLASYKSMKGMQVIQPQVNKLKEKYKDDPTAMNKEMMKLMRENNANPLMGCLPMLLQLPVFFALYQVLDHSIELYKSPFILWVHDLSLKDPLYVLPALMGITMFIQQKITPTAMDPAQAKVLLMMPIVFTFLMISLPSGLTLYIFISTLVGIIQQYLFMRNSGPKTTAIQAKA